MIATPTEDALYNHAALHAVGLGPRPGRYRREDIQFAGGVLVRSLGRTFIVTANHFLDVVPPDRLSAIFAPEGGILSLDCTVEELGRTVHSPPPDLVSHSVLVDPKGVIRPVEPLADVAAIEIDARIVPEWCRVHELPSSSTSLPVAGRTAIIVGQPMAATDIRPDPAGVYSGYSGYVSLKLPVRTEDRPDTWFEEFSTAPAFDPEMHFSMHLDFADAKFDVQGMSGSGVWVVPPGCAEGGTLWRPRLQLAGIQVSQMRSRSAVKATRIDVARSLLDHARG